MSPFIRRLVAATAGSIASAQIACAGNDSIIHRSQMCVQPQNSYELCYEAIEHERPLADASKGSPGLSMRIYGKAQGHDVILFTSSGGPNIPETWLEQHGHMDCYGARVDFDAVIAALREPVSSGPTSRHRKYAVNYIDHLRDTPEFIEALPECENITNENMEDWRKSFDAQVSANAVAQEE